MADTRFDPRANSVGVLRFALATMVVYWHCVQIGGAGLDPVAEPAGGLDCFRALGAAGFFARTGWLIAARLRRPPPARAFARPRAPRTSPRDSACSPLS